MKILTMCLKWKVLASLAAVGVGVYLFAPGLLAEAVPILLLAACPLSTLLMMWATQQSQGQGRQTSQEPDVGLTREEQVAQLRAARSPRRPDRGAGARGGPPGRERREAVET